MSVLVRGALGAGEPACRRAMLGGASQYERNVVTFGRLYLNTFAPTRYYTPPASKLTWMSRLARALSTSWTKV